MESASPALMPLSPELYPAVVQKANVHAFVAQRAAALGSTVVATTLDPVQPAPAPLKWLSRTSRGIRSGR